MFYIVYMVDQCYTRAVCNRAHVSEGYGIHWPGLALGSEGSWSADEAWPSVGLQLGGGWAP